MLVEIPPKPKTEPDIDQPKRAPIHWPEIPWWHPDTPTKDKPDDGSNMTKIEQAAVFRKATDHIKRGWCQGRLQDDQGRVCAIGALALALGVPIGKSTPGNKDVIFFAGLASSRLHFCYSRFRAFGLGFWNDVNVRTVDEVVTFFEDLAFDLELTEFVKRSDR